MIVAAAVASTLALELALGVALGLGGLLEVGQVGAAYWMLALLVRVPQPCG